MVSSGCNKHHRTGGLSSRHHCSQSTGATGLAAPEPSVRGMYTPLCLVSSHGCPSVCLCPNLLLLWGHQSCSISDLTLIQLPLERFSLSPNTVTLGLRASMCEFGVRIILSQTPMLSFQPLDTDLWLRSPCLQRPLPVHACSTGASATRGAGGHFWAPLGWRLSPAEASHQGGFGEQPQLGLWHLPGAAKAATAPLWALEVVWPSPTFAQGSQGWRGPSWSPASESLPQGGGAPLPPSSGASNSCGSEDLGTSLPWLHSDC